MTLSYEIRSHVGVGELRFGMSREQVTSLLGPPNAEIPPDPFYGDTTLLFGDIGLAVFVDSKDEVCAIESRGCPLILHGENLRDKGGGALRDLLTRLDPNAALVGDVLTSRILGIAANTADDETPQGIIALRPGYYDRPRRDVSNVAGWLAQGIVRRPPE